MTNRKGHFFKITVKNTHLKSDFIPVRQNNAGISVIWRMHPQSKRIQKFSFCQPSFKGSFNTVKSDETQIAVVV